MDGLHFKSDYISYRNWQSADITITSTLLWGVNPLVPRYGYNSSEIQHLCLSTGAKGVCYWKYCHIVSQQKSVVECVTMYVRFQIWVNFQMFSNVKIIKFIALYVTLYHSFSEINVINNKKITTCKPLMNVESTWHEPFNIDSLLNILNVHWYSECTLIFQ